MDWSIWRVAAPGDRTTCNIGQIFNDLLVLNTLKYEAGPGYFDVTWEGKTMRINTDGRALELTRENRGHAIALARYSGCFTKPKPTIRASDAGFYQKRVHALWRMEEHGHPGLTAAELECYKPDPADLRWTTQ
jgi:hypothetical protein